MTDLIITVILAFASGAFLVGGEDAFYVSHDSQYVRFARAGSETVLISHPLDVEPPEARRGTPYFSELKP